MARKVYKNRLTVDFCAELLFDIVVDVKKYPEFLSWCQKVEVLSCKDQYIIADTTINFKGMDFSYVSEIECKKPGDESDGFVKILSTDGVFKSLYSTWKFYREGPKKSSVEFYIEYEFRSKVLQLLLNLVYKNAQTKLMLAFFKRAKQLTLQESSL